MANETTNIKLRKPVPTENFDIDRDFNANWDKIDEEFGNLEAGVGNTYTKDEADAKGELKADKADTYTKDEVDAKDALKADLSEIETARGKEATLVARLDSTDSELNDLTQDYTQHKLDYIEQRRQDQLKVAKVEKDINDYQSTMASVNVNQEAKQSATGYGVVSLPKNSVSGQVGVSVKGRTATNIVPNGDFKSGKANWKNPNGTDGVTNNEFIYTTAILSGASRIEQSITTIIGDKYFVRGEIYPKYANAMYILLGGSGTPNAFAVPNEWNKHSGIVTPINDDPIRFYHSTVSDYIVGDTIKFRNILAINLTQTFGAGNEPTKEQCDKMFANYFEGTKSTVSASRLKSVGKNLFDKSKVTGANVQSIDFKVKPNTNYTTSLSPVTGEECRIDGIESSTQLLVYGITSPRTFNSGNNTRIRVYLRKDSGNTIVSQRQLDNFMINEGTVATPYEPYTESTQYLPNVGELRSLPNGVKDEIRVSGDKTELVKRVGKTVLDGTLNYGEIVSSDTVVYARIPEFLANNNSTYTLEYYGVNSDLGEFKVYLNSHKENGTPQLIPHTGGGLYVVIPKDKISTLTLTGFKDYLNANPITLTYQLAEPIITPINVSGTLLSNPSGTVYVENVVADAGTYTTRFDIKELQLPIKSIDKLIKYDFATGVQTVLDTSLAVINADKKSFTHPDLTDSDMVFVDYFYDVESTLCETTIEYLDSRHTIKDSVNNKFYKWDIKSANGVPTVNLTEVL